MKYFFYSIIAICITSIIHTIIGSLTPELLTVVLTDFCKVLGALIIAIFSIKLFKILF